MKFFIILMLIISISYAKDEKRIKIGIIDTGISIDQTRSEIMCKKGIKTFFNDNGIGIDKHGINIFNIITKGLDAKKYCIISYKVFNNFRNKNNIDIYNKAIKMAIDDNVKYLNISMGGNNFNWNEYSLIQKSLTKGMVVIVAAGNDGKNLDKYCNYYPACYIKYLKEKNFKVVGAYNLDLSNYGSIVTNFEDGYMVGNPKLSGTSQAAANYTKKILIKKGNMW
ncbi:MAG: S8 family serine peptidase [Candidatus Nanoarchaeia archaeon]|nr:S8 family serine peptidase [Candidatus Nanoarchaeia archaeon]